MSSDSAFASGSQSTYQPDSLDDKQRDDSYVSGESQPGDDIDKELYEDSEPHVMEGW